MTAELQRQEDTQVDMLAIIAAASRDPSVDVAKMRELLDIRREVIAEQARVAFSASMAACQSEMLPVFRDAENSQTRSRYARLESIDVAIRPVYTRHGFALSFDAPESNADGALVVCRVLHQGGHTERYSLRGALDTSGFKGASNKTDIQGLGSTISYLRRYLTMMIFNLSLTNEDNDGNGRKPDAREPLTEHQLSNLTDMVASCDLSPERQSKMLAVYGVKTLADLPSARYAELMSQLRKIADRRTL